MSSTSLFIKAAEIAEMMGKSKLYGYKVVRELNKELSENGYMIVEGQTNRQYFYGRFYGLLQMKGDVENASISKKIKHGM